MKLGIQVYRTCQMTLSGKKPQKTQRCGLGLVMWKLFNRNETLPGCLVGHRIYGWATTEGYNVIEEDVVHI